MKIVKIEFPIIGDDRGKLISLEQLKNIPFEIYRVYYIFDTTTNLRRGFHAHLELQQVLVAINGSCKVLLDDGKEKVNIELNSRTEGMLVDKMVWHEMYDFSDDLVLMVLASDYYKESDYIRDYNRFLKIKNSQYTEAVFT